MFPGGRTIHGRPAGIGRIDYQHRPRRKSGIKIPHVVGAEDLSQDTFIKVLNNIDKYDPSYKFSSWIFKIAHNTTVDHIRKKTPETLSLDGSPHARTQEQAEATSFTAVDTAETPDQFTSSREVGVEIDAKVSSDLITAIFLSEYARPRLRRIVKPALETLAVDAGASA